MPIILTLAATLLLAVLLGPQIWVRRVLARHAIDRPDLPGTGGEFARHLLDEAGLDAVKVEITDIGDHYDPENRAVRLLRQHHDGRSVSAVAVAAHEVSHAVQHARGEQAFLRRFELVRKVTWVDRLASGVLLLAPVVFILVKSPTLLAVQIVAGILLLAIRIAVHIVTLPVEFDASFNRAMSVLEHGKFVAEEDMSAARHILSAAAYTYVAQALIDLINLPRLLRGLRF